VVEATVNASLAYSGRCAIKRSVIKQSRKIESTYREKKKLLKSF
jgi:hypothetical protein